MKGRRKRVGAPIGGLGMAGKSEAEGRRAGGGVSLIQHNKNEGFVVDFTMRCTIP